MIFCLKEQKNGSKIGTLCMVRVGGRGSGFKGCVFLSACHYKVSAVILKDEPPRINSI